MIWALANYLLEQLVAMGQGVAGLTGEAIPYQVGVVGFVAVMVTYSWVGGMRAVAFTDVMQGVALLVGVLALTLGGLSLIGWDLGAATRQLLRDRPALAAVPPTEVSVRWLSLVLIVALGASVYPHAVQRIYAARSEKTLKTALGRMALMPPLTAGLVFLVGIVGVVLFPGLDAAESEQLVGMIASRVAGLGSLWFAAMLLLFGGVVAAIVSTADSALLSLSSLISHDLYARYARGGADEERQVRVGKLWSLVIVGALLVVAWNPPATLYGIFVLKLELLVQLAPVFFVGIYWSRLTALPVLLGMIAGSGIAGGVTLFDLEPPFGIHCGLVGLGVNLLICVGGSLLAPASDVERSVVEQRIRPGQ
jgi:SSS family solute:Na+ symporter/sodium/pantothenate symporter